MEALKENEIVVTVIVEGETKMKKVSFLEFNIEISKSYTPIDEVAEKMGITDKKWIDDAKRIWKKAMFPRY